MKSKPALPQFSVIIHNVRSILNVGAIFRTADGAGATKIYLTGYTPGPDTHLEKMTKTALGAEKTIVWERCKRVGDLIKHLRVQGVQIVALEQTRRSVDYRKFKPTFPCALILGNEVKGVPLMSHNQRIATSDMSQSVNRLCNACGASHNLFCHIIEIPMRGKKESLNVAVACGIAAYEIMRRT